MLTCLQPNEIETEEKVAVRLESSATNNQSKTVN